MILYILESKSAAVVAAVFVDFPKNKCNFLHKNSEAKKEKIAAVMRNHVFGIKRPKEPCNRGSDPPGRGNFFWRGGIACPFVKYIWHAVDITQI